MKRTKKLASLLMAVILAFSFSTTASATFFGTSEVISQEGGKGTGVTISNVTAIAGGYNGNMFYFASTPAIVTFTGTDFEREEVTYCNNGWFSNFKQWGFGDVETPIGLVTQNYSGSDNVTLTTPGLYKIHSKSKNSSTANWFTLIIENSTKNAVKNNASIILNGKEICLDAYTIEDTNYFKLRDVSDALKGTDKKFDVAWDEANNAINLTTNVKYDKHVGSISRYSGPDAEITGVAAILSTSSIFINGEHVNLKAYTINDSNYCKLRDIAYAFKFKVDYDDATGKIIIDTTKYY